MRRVSDYIRSRLLREPVSYKELIETEWSHKFERLMRKRLIVGALRYTRMWAYGAPKWDTIGSMIRRLEDYRWDGNQEHLVDVANLAMVEFTRPTHPKAHFRSIDDGAHTEILDRK